MKPRKGRQRKTWSRTIDDIFHSLFLEKGEILDDMHEGISSLKSFMACIEDDLRERKPRSLEKGLGGRGNLKKYLHGRSDEGARLLFMFRSGTHGLNEELGRHSDGDGRVQCTLCGAECKSVVHVLWECSSYSTCRDNFQESLSFREKPTYFLTSIHRWVCKLVFDAIYDWRSEFSHNRQNEKANPRR